jgi:RNA polymerase sigma-70 factor (ECF subfamily)
MSEWLNPDGTPDFHRLFDLARPQLLAVARRVVRSEADAEDVVQQAFINAIRAGDRFEARAQATSWMYRIVYNTALMHLRSRRRKGAESLDALPPEVGENVVHDQREHLAAPPSPDAGLERGALGALIGRALARLSPLDQDIVRMRLHEDRSTKEVAKALGLSTAATKTRLHRARLMLQELIGESEAAMALS